MPGNNAFAPGGTKALAATGNTSVRIALPVAAEQQILVTLPAAASEVAFIAFGDSTVTATVPSSTAGSLPILPGSAQLFSVGAAATHFAQIVAGAGTSTIYITCGHGS